MDSITIIDGGFEIPEKYQDERRIHIKQPWSSQTIWKQDLGLDKVHIWFRSPKAGDKPYIEEGFIEINGDRYKAIEEDE